MIDRFVIFGINIDNDDDIDNYTLCIVFIKDIEFYVEGLKKAGSALNTQSAIRMI